ncbi:hypothetical protein [Streptomyces sp. NPDC056190]
MIGTSAGGGMAAVREGDGGGHADALALASRVGLDTGDALRVAGSL